MQVEQTVNVQYSMPALVNLKVVGNGFGCPGCSIEQRYLIGF